MALNLEKLLIFHALWNDFIIIIIISYGLRKVEGSMPCVSMLNMANNKVVIHFVRALMYMANKQ